MSAMAEVQPWLHEARLAALFDVLLDGFANVFLEANEITGNLAQRGYRGLVAALNQRAVAPAQLARSRRGQHDEGEAVGNLFETVFYSYASHG
jgi:hypothetical protein